MGGNLINQLRLVTENRFASLFIPYDVHCTALYVMIIGECTCPDGQTYLVGDNDDYCLSLACVGGDVTRPCAYGVHLPETSHGMKVTCGVGAAPALGAGGLGAGVQHSADTAGAAHADIDDAQPSSAAIATVVVCIVSVVAVVLFVATSVTRSRKLGSFELQTVEVSDEEAHEPQTLHVHVPVAATYV